MITVSFTAHWKKHRQAMVEPLWYRRLNYETRWLDRRQLQAVSYEAISRLVEIKGEYGVLPPEFCRAILKTIDETQQLLREMERASCPTGKLPAALRDEVRSYNRKMLAYSSDQIIPVRRPFGGRWFDDATVPRHMIEDNLASRPGRAGMAPANRGGSGRRTAALSYYPFAHYPVSLSIDGPAELRVSRGRLRRRR
jgi:clorobiocin/coumermycin A biosynthesis protein CloN6/CouN6